MNEKVGRNKRRAVPAVNRDEMSPVPELRCACSGLQEPPDRRAFTLIELVVAIGAITLIATLATTVLHAMMQQQKVVGQQLTVGHSLMRLGTRFRTDVHGAQGAETDGSTISLLGKTSTITYSLSSPGTIRRTVESAGSTRQDHFDLQEHHEVRFDVQHQPRRRGIVKLTVRPPAEEPNAASQQPRYAISNVGMTTLAELGRDYRWQGEGIGP